MAKTKRHINKNFRLLVKTYLHNQNQKFKDCKHVILEGASRSGKTISCIDFIIYYCMLNSDKGKKIFAIRETYASHKTTLYTDFSNRLDAFGIDNPFRNAKEVAQFDIFGNTVYFMGADKESKFMGAGCDIAYFNELIDIQNNIFDQTEQRVAEMWIGDYNPKFSVHWVYNKLLNRPDVKYLHSTFKDNPFCPDVSLRKILSYEPTPENIERGTADDYNWSVFGLGKRTAPEGQIFKYVNWINHFPDDIEFYHYGMDFGYAVDPCAIVKYAETTTDIYLQELCYEPLDSASLINEVLSKVIDNKKSIIACDGADPDMIKELFAYGWRTIAVKKPAGSIKYGISLLKGKRLNIVRSINFVREQENYCYRSISGIQIEEPVDKFNHLWDASRYAAFANGASKPITVY